MTEKKQSETPDYSEAYLQAFRERCAAVSAELTRHSQQIKRELKSLVGISRFLTWKCPPSSLPPISSPAFFFASPPDRSPDYRLEDQVDHCRRELELFLTERKHFEQQMRQKAEF